MYAIRLRHSRDADGTPDFHGFARALTGAPGRTVRGRPELFGHGSCARAGADVAVSGS